MFCKIIFFYKDEDWTDILKHLKKINSNFRIVTNNFLLNEYLREQKIATNSLEELIPQNSDEYYKITKNSYDIMKKNTKTITDFTFRGYEIITPIENQILKEINLHELAKKSLDTKENIIFIFQGYQFSYYWLIDTAKSLGYNCEQLIYKIEKNKIINFSITKKPEQLSTMKKFHNLRLKLNLLSTKKKIGFTRLSNRNNLKKSNTSKNNEGFNILHFFTKIIVIKFLIFLQLKPTKKIFKKIDTKINYDLKNPAKDFFILYSWRDDLLSSTYPLMQYFEEQKIPFHVIVFDFVTASFLQKQKFHFLNFFEEVVLLSEILKKKKEIRELINNVENGILKSNLPIFNNKMFIKYIINEFVTSIAIIVICDYIFSKYDPNSVMVSEDGTRNINSVLSVTKKKKVMSYYIPSVIIKPHWPRYKSEKICIYGNQGINELHSVGYTDDQILLTGNPRYDKYKEIKIYEQKEILEQKFRIDKDKKLLVIAMNRWKNRDEVWMSKLIKFCNINNLEVVIKIHPTYKRWMNAFSENKMKKISDLCINEKFLISYELDIDSLIAAADLVISDYSNVGIQAVLLEKPLLTVNLTGEKWKDVIRFDKFGASIYIENYDKLEKIILEILKEDKHLDDFKIGRKKIIDDYNFYNDGFATKRIFDIMRKKTVM